MTLDCYTVNKLIFPDDVSGASVCVSASHGGNNDQDHCIWHDDCAVFCSRVVEAIEIAAPKKPNVSSIFDCKLQHRLCGDKDPVIYASSSHFSSYRNNNRAESLIERNLSVATFVKNSASDCENCSKKSSTVDAFGANVTAGSVVSIVKLTLDSFVSISYASRV